MAGSSWLKYYKGSTECGKSSVYDAVSTRIDAMNDIIMGNVSDNEFREIMALEAEILGLVAAC